jgi:beta-N-acetylhexosaminidase
VDPLGHESELWPGRHIIISVAGPTLDEATRELLSEIAPGGVILLEDNVQNLEQVARLVGEIKEAVGLGASAADLPLIYVDQEGGPVNRLDLPNAPSAREIGEGGGADEARAAARRYADAARAANISVILAPVLDVRASDGTELIAARSFSSSPYAVSAMGLAFADALSQAGVIPVVKHFPGHGATRQDSHYELAVLEGGPEELAEALYPFSEAVRRGIPGIMSGHIAVPELQEEPKPASLSGEIVHDLLREQWDYDGVVITDDLAMGAVEERTTLQEALVAALQAGNDAAIVLERDPDFIRSLCAAIEEAVRSGALPRERLMESVRRLDTWQELLREPAALDNTPPLPATARRAKDKQQQQAPSEWIIHEVRPAEFLSGLAAQYGVTTRELVEWNNLDDTVIHPEQRLRIRPRRAATSPDLPQTQGQAEGEPAAVQEPFEYYLVEPGDTLFGVATRYRTTVRRLKEMNNFDDENVLLYGTRIRVPKR